MQETNKKSPAIFIFSETHRRAFQIKEFTLNRLGPTPQLLQPCPLKSHRMASCLAASHTTLQSSHPLHRSICTSAIILSGFRSKQLASGQYIMQSRQPFFATHFSSVTRATLYIYLVPSLRFSKLRRSGFSNHDFHVVFLGPFCGNFI